EQHVGEAPGGAPDVHRRHPGRIKREVIECMGELYSAARDPGVVASSDLDRTSGLNLLAGLGDLLFTAEHQPGKDQRLGAGAAFSQPAIDQQLIDADLSGADRM